MARPPSSGAGRAGDPLHGIRRVLYTGADLLTNKLIALGRTLKRQALDLLAYFDHPGTSNGPTDTINGRLEHLRGTALGFRNLTHCLLDTGGFKTELHCHL